MTEQDPEPLPYALWVEDALRGVVRRALEHTSLCGLADEHHFYVSFRTTDAGVHVPDHLRARYPSEMTIVLQHQFWDLEVGTEAFNVSLRFGGRLTPLRVPFTAITAFGDPSVNFGLQFVTPTGDEDEDLAPPPEVSTAGSPAKAEPAKEEPAAEKEDGGRVISFDTFRKK